MTVKTQVPKIDPVTGNGVTRTFSFSPMVIFAADELEVVTTVIATGVETVIARGTNGTTYANLLTSFPGTGSIDYPASGGTLLPSTETITIRRVLTLEQQTDLGNSAYNPQVQEDQFDKLVMIDLQQQEQLDRSLRFPVSYDNASLNQEINTPLGSDVRFLRLNAARDELDFAALAQADGSASDASPVNVTTGVAAPGTGADFSRSDHVHHQDTSVVELVNDTSPQQGGVIDSNSFAYDESEATAVASGATTDIWATTGNTIHVTGTITITSFGTAPRVGAWRKVIFDGALVLTDGANLNLPGGGNITTAADDFAFVYAETTTLFKVLYFPVSGRAVIDESEGSAVASGATTDIWVRDGTTLHVTGTTTITSFGTAPHVGAWRKVIFDGILTLTDGANLNLPGAANITTAADDFAFVYAETVTLFKVLYFPVDGRAVIGGGITHLSVTHTSDTALATRAGGGTQIGSTLSSVSIPTAGVIRMTLLEVEFDETENTADAQVAFALDVGGTKVWATSDLKTGVADDVNVDVDQNVGSRLIGAGKDGALSAALVLSFDIVAGSFPTGSRDVKVFFGDNANSSTGEVTVTGTTVTCRILIEVIDTT